MVERKDHAMKTTVVILVAAVASLAGIVLFLLARYLPLD
jgi:hypothetical protein